LKIIHTKLQLYSIFNYDLFRFSLKGNPDCACGFECESVFHFFLECQINDHYWEITTISRIELKIFYCSNISNKIGYKL
jgi:hypothetical protein